jgi:hypothetical protein
MQARGVGLTKMKLEGEWTSVAGRLRGGGGGGRNKGPRLGATPARSAGAAAALPVVGGGGGRRGGGGRAGRPPPPPQQQRAPVASNDRAFGVGVGVGVGGERRDGRKAPCRPRLAPPSRARIHLRPTPILLRATSTRSHQLHNSIPSRQTARAD